MVLVVDGNDRRRISARILLYPRNKRLPDKNTETNMYSMCRNVSRPLLTASAAAAAAAASAAAVATPINMPNPEAFRIG